jgi:hypothetical protein
MYTLLIYNTLIIYYKFNIECIKTKNFIIGNCNKINLIKLTWIERMIFFFILYKNKIK